MSDLVQRLRKRSTDEPFRRGDPALYAEAADRIEQDASDLARVYQRIQECNDRIEQQDAELAELRAAARAMPEPIYDMDCLFCYMTWSSTSRYDERKHEADCPWWVLQGVLGEASDG